VYKAVEISSGKSVAGLRLCFKARRFSYLRSTTVKIVRKYELNASQVSVFTYCQFNILFLSKFQLINSLLRAPSHHPQAGEKHLNQLFKKKPRVTEVQLFSVLDSHQLSES